MNESIFKVAMCTIYMLDEERIKEKEDTCMAQNNFSRKEQKNRKGMEIEKGLAIC